ncbi:hypothetical protein, partial [Rhizobium johnstonii]|uniref:hypothetical protein n=1 Tax=Rhizobium johnstonii TaxID=3019933 RepID=UPI003F980307
DQDGVYVTGSMAFDYEWDFENLMQSDSVEIEISLTAEKFDALERFIADGRPKAVVTLGSIDGFYSQWSPSIRTQEIKILSSLEDQKVKIDAGSEIAPPALGKAGEFALRLLLGPDEDKLPEPDLGGDTQATDQRPTEQVHPTKVDLVQLEKKLSRLAMPLWIAVGLLAINLFLR